MLFLESTLLVINRNMHLLENTRLGFPDQILGISKGFFLTIKLRLQANQDSSNNQEL